MRDAMANRNYFQQRVRGLERHEAAKDTKESNEPTLEGRCSEIAKLKDQSTPWRAVLGGTTWRTSRCSRRPRCELGGQKDKETDLISATLATAGFKPARDVLLHDHGEKIAKHLTEKVYTAEHFSLLRGRLVSKMSKRVCGLIEQSIKYVGPEWGRPRSWRDRVLRGWAGRWGVGRGCCSTEGTRERERVAAGCDLRMTYTLRVNPHPCVCDDDGRLRAHVRKQMFVPLCTMGRRAV